MRLYQPTAGIVVAAFAILSLSTAVCRADDAVPTVQVQAVASGLDTPISVVVSPTGSDLFVSESGAGRVVRIASTKNAKPAPIIAGFPVGQSAALPQLKVGPLGLTLTSSGYLVVGSGGQGPGKDAVRLFVLPTGSKRLPQPLTVDDAKKTLRIKPSYESKTGEGEFYGLVAPPYALFSTSPGDADRGWISRAWIRGASSARFDTVLDLRPFIESQRTVHAERPMALTISKRSELVVGEAGKLDRSRDSLLSFYDPANGRLLLSLPTGLFDIVGLAYSPQTGLLYTIDLAWADPKQGGLFRLDAVDQAGRLAVKAVKISTLDRPTSLCFAPDGSLYVTTLGKTKAATNGASNEKTGQLLKITGGL
jgi:hypothetical protein